jgi:hypothetical protein
VIAGRPVPYSQRGRNTIRIRGSPETGRTRRIIVVGR